MLAVWQPVQVDHEDGGYSDMQKVEKMMAEAKSIEVLEFKFNETEVSEANIQGAVVGEARDETAFKQRLADFLLEHGIADDMSPPPPPPIPGVFHLNATFSY